MINSPVLLDAALSDPGSGAIVDYQWSFLFAPPPVPLFSQQGLSTTAFTPTISSVYFVGLQVTNDCGGVGPALASEMINVQ